VRRFTSDMATQIMAAKMLCLKAAAEKDQGMDISQSQLLWLNCFSNGDGYHN
jgi:alkylation response protein AidB-like acyl-CoA dehydrogenase